ncbi:MAG: acyl-CoA thioesterase [Nonlabens sp.]|nr:acyl-CoA thioesterase [Nonlabens sp.]MDP5101400.1 acyl-CoA thioesterase [Nonlabens sp.]
MKKTLTKITTRYAETDQMGVIHHANYLIYLEQARMEWLNTLGFSYVEMEKNGVMLPVFNIQIDYKKPLFVAQEITVTCKLLKPPSTRVIFEYEVINNENQLCAHAQITLVFTDSQSFRPRKPLTDFIEACKNHFD